MLVLGVDRVNLDRNLIEDNNLVGITVVDYCLAVDGSDFDCDTNPPEVEPAPDDNRITRNTVIDNGLNPDPGPFAVLASEIVLLGGTNNCFSDNTIGGITLPGVLPGC